MDFPLFPIDTVPNGETKINIKTMVFQKGIDFIRKKIKEP